MECGADDDPKQLHWTRIHDIFTDQRTAPHEQTFFKNIILDGHTPELDIFWSLMPLSPAKLLQIVRGGAEKANCTLTWNLDHINAALCIIFGGAQFKEMTDLWAVKRKGMMPLPDFGLFCLAIVLNASCVIGLMVLRPVGKSCWINLGLRFLIGSKASTRQDTMNLK